MKQQISLLGFSVSLAVGLLFAACTNENGAAGSSDGTSAEAYELNSEKELASPMDTVQQVAPGDSAASADTMN